MLKTLRRGAHAAALVALSIATVVPAAAIGQDATADRLPEPGTLLEPGRYVSDAVGPTVDFRVEEGWIVSAAPEGPIFTLQRADQPGAVVTVTRFDGVVYLDSCDPTSTATVEPTMPRLAEVIAGNPFLNPAVPDPTSVDGYPGVQLDIGVPAYTECRLPFILLWALPIEEGGEFVQVADQQSRFVLVDVDGDVLVVAIETFPGVPFGSFLEDAMALVGSMRLEPGAYIPPDASPAASPEPSPPAATPRPSPATESA